MEERLSSSLSMDGFSLILSEEGQMLSLPSTPYQQGYWVYHRERKTFGSLWVRMGHDPVPAEVRLPIWEVIKESGGNGLFPGILSLGVNDGLVYYITDLATGTPLDLYCERSLPWHSRLAAKVVLQFIERVREQLPVEHYCLQFESLWLRQNEVGAPYLSVAELHFHPHPEADRENAALAKDIFRRLIGGSTPSTFAIPGEVLLSGSEDLVSVEKSLRDFLTDPPKLSENDEEGILSISNYLDQLLPGWKDEFQTEASKEKRHDVVSGMDFKTLFLEFESGEWGATRGDLDPNVIIAKSVDRDPGVEPRVEGEDDYFDALKKNSPKIQIAPQPNPGRNPIAKLLPGVIVFGLTTLVVGSWIYLVGGDGNEAPRTTSSENFSAEETQEKRDPEIGAPSVHFANLSDVTFEDPLSPLEPPTMAVVSPDQWSLTFTRAAQARKENRLVDAIECELEALRMAPNSHMIRQRMDGDLYQLLLSGEHRFSPREIEVLYHAASLNPMANDIIVKFFRKVETVETNQLPAENISEMMQKAAGIFGNPESKPEELKEAFLHCLAASGQNNLEAIHRTGICLIEGKGTMAIPEKGIVLLQKAVMCGYHPAMLALGRYYLEGTVIEKNEQRSALLFAEAIERGNTSAYAELGSLYAEGRGIEKSPGKAADLYEAGARRGDAACMFHFGRCLEMGFGRAENHAYSIYWFRKSAINGNEGAIRWCAERKIPTAPTS